LHTYGALTFRQNTHTHKIKLGAGELAQWLRTLAALLEDLGWILSNYIHGSSQLAVGPIPGALKPSFGLCGQQVSNRQTYVQARHSYTWIKIRNLK